MPTKIPDYREYLEESKDIVCAITPEGYASWGWTPPPDEQLDWIAVRVTDMVQGGVPQPSGVYPSPLYGFEVRVEWDIGSYNPKLEVSLEDRKGEWHKGAKKRKLDLNKEEDWTWVGNEVRRLKELKS